jgi:hypothetical protein
MLGTVSILNLFMSGTAVDVKPATVMSLCSLPIQRAWKQVGGNGTKSLKLVRMTGRSNVAIVSLIRSLFLLDGHYRPARRASADHVRPIALVNRAYPFGWGKNKDKRNKA